MRKPYPRNAPGPLYVEYDCCITCGMPVEIAPEIFSWDDEKREQETHCFVKRQPVSDEEFDKVVEAMDAAEINCIFYCGKNERWKEKLRAAGLGEQIEYPEE